MYKAPSFGLGMKKDLRESIESVYNINNSINEEEQLIISLFEEFLKENFHVEMLTEEDLDYILESEFPQWLEENEEYLTEILQLTPIVAAAARAALPKILQNFAKTKINRRKKRPQQGWGPGELRRTLKKAGEKETPPPLPESVQEEYFPRENVSKFLSRIRSLFGLPEKKEKKPEKIGGSLQSDDRTKRFSQKGLVPQQGTSGVYIPPNFNIVNSQENRLAAERADALKQAKLEAEKTKSILQRTKEQQNSRLGHISRSFRPPQPNGNTRQPQNLNTGETPGQPPNTRSLKSGSNKKPETELEKRRIEQANRARVVDLLRKEAERNQPPPQPPTGNSGSSSRTGQRARSARKQNSWRSAPEGSWTASREGLGYRSNLKAAKSQAYRKAYSAYKARKSPKKWSDSVFDPKD